jgi:hypothetical protein
MMDGREVSVEAGDVPAHVSRRRRPNEQNIDDVEVLLSKYEFLRRNDAGSRRRAKAKASGASFSVASSKSAAARQLAKTARAPAVPTKAPTNAK